jgi:hypothetical protein
MRWKIFSGALNAKILIGFMERLTRQQTTKIFLILDSLRRLCTGGDLIGCKMCLGELLGCSAF